MSDLVGPILEFVKFVGRPAKKYLNYHRKFDKYVDDLKQAKEDLRDREADIQRRLQDERRFEKKTKQEVESWLKKVEEKINLAQVVEEKVSKGTCFFRSCLGKQVDEMTQEIKKVHDKGLFPGGLVVNDPSAENVELPTEVLVGSTPAEEIYEYLMGDKVGKIGVWGMGGIGKTTIVKNVYNMLLKKPKFSKLIWVTVSQVFDIRRLQKVIASQMKEDLSDDDDTTIRAGKLLTMLREHGKYVLILDDVWTSFPLNDVGIPEPEADNGCKLMLTSRCKDVVRLMGCQEVPVKCLAEHEAFQLFLRKVGHDLVSNSKIESTMNLMVKECSGLPLAIVTIAGTIKGNSDHIMWENALSELQGHVSSIQVPEDKVFGCLRFSFHHLEPKLRPCFLYCALYPEDYEIPKIDIVEHWLEEGYIDQMRTRKEMHNRGHYFLSRLEECCLLERVPNGDHIKMHDLVRDMALRITKESPRFFVKNGLQFSELFDEQQQLTEDLEKVSFMGNYIETIPSNLLPSKCLKLTTLFLSNNDLRIIPDTFFDYMPNLKILDLSRNRHIMNLPGCLSNLVNLTTLLLSLCVRLVNVPSLQKLVALRKLDLGSTNIREIPQGLEALEKLKYLNVGCTLWLEQIPNGIFLKLIHLQQLVLYPALLREEDIRELKKLEVLVCCTGVHGLSMYVGNKKLPNEYLIVVSQNPNWIPLNVEDNTKMILFVGVDINIEDSISVPSDIHELVLDNCGKVRSADVIGGLKDATNLKRCDVKRCEYLEYLFSSWCEPLQTLEHLELFELTHLKNLVEESGPPLPRSFSSLKKVSLCRVHGIKKLFSATSILQDLRNLEELEVNECNGMEEIIAFEEIEEEGEFNINNSTKFILPKLRKLILWSVSNLKSICSRNVIMECNSLQEFEISWCDKLERIPLYFSSLDNAQPPSIPSSLKTFLQGNEEWWDRVEWDVHPNAKDIFGAFFRSK